MIIKVGTVGLQFSLRSKTTKKVNYVLGKSIFVSRIIQNVINVF